MRITLTVKFLVFFQFIAIPIMAESMSNNSDLFQTEAKTLVMDLKSNLLKNLTSEISKNGTEAAIPFCHINVKTIAKDAAKDQMKKYDFGRTSHKIRNEKNKADAWMLPYLEKFQGTYFDQNKTAEYQISGTQKDGKKFYLEPLFVNTQCLQCHGENLAKNVQEKIQIFYPKDQATGFKLNEFRGLIWVKEK